LSGKPDAVELHQPHHLVEIGFDVLDSGLPVKSSRRLERVFQGVRGAFYEGLGFGIKGLLRRLDGLDGEGTRDADDAGCLHGLVDDVLRYGMPAHAFIDFVGLGAAGLLVLVNGILQDGGVALMRLEGNGPVSEALG
jgi:hypothetical protein